MKNKEPSVRSALMISVISGVGGFINGVWVVLAGTSYFNRLSPYALIFRAIFRVVPSQFVEDAHYFLFRSGFQFILAPLLGTLLGAVVGWVSSRFGEKPATSFLVKTGAITSGIGGFVSLGTSF
jgi:ABC-type amino acid transport system permease subunit